MRFRIASAAVILGAALSTSAIAQAAPAYRYAGSHAGGPANALIRSGSPRAVVRPVRAPAYRYAGSHAGGPANGLPRY